LEKEMNANDILDREFLTIRSKILDVAAAMDRLDRAAGDVAEDPRMKLLNDALALVLADDDDPARAEKMQMLFSREYDQQWMKSLKVEPRQR
jgi:hypothetical protein